MPIILTLLLSISISMLTLVVLYLLTAKYVRDNKKSYRTHELTKLLIVLISFIFIYSCYNSILYLSQYGLISQSIFFALISPSIQIIPQLGIFAAVVAIAHFILSSHLENFKANEDSLMELEALNQELDKKARELEGSQEILQKKVKELEKFNDIAKSREENMVELIKKIEVLEKKLNKKN